MMWFLAEVVGFSELCRISGLVDGLPSAPGIGYLLRKHGPSVEQGLLSGTD